MRNKPKTILGQMEHLERWLAALDTNITVRFSSRKFPLFVFVNAQGKGLMAVDFKSALSFLKGVTEALREKSKK